MPKLGGGGCARTIHVFKYEVTPTLTFGSILDVFLEMSRFSVTSVLGSTWGPSGGGIGFDKGTNVEGVSTLVMFVSTSDMFIVTSKLLVSSV